ncbi:hypothetical protein BJF83_07410 [Nocardiopsis sp. CNR-923]|uniref:hypothetical protein n=1 Tax=Nocardiopsis sp. CNR-923 TaxID=1904965 RepID=UPI000965ECD7|nr:hypothetical protein [Nocardiopsis sp. CNR-923]OLT24280.1 hypothetical protein BJF83_07410 [Nocardiopsis sp. CNR-923]
MTHRAPGLSRRRILAGAALVGTAAAALPGTAAAAESAADRGRTIGVVLEPDTLDVPEEIPCGVVSFHVSTPEAVGRSLLLVRLADGVTADRYLDLLAATSTWDPAEKAEAARAVAAAAHNLGGAVVAAGTDAGFTQVLRPGRYLLINFGYASGGRPVAREVRATRQSWAGHAGTDGFVVHRETSDGVEFSVSRRLPANGRYTLLNTTGTPQEAMFCRVQDGTTEEDVRAYFDALREGRTPPVQPLLTRPVGMAPLGARQYGTLHAEFTPGPYALFSFTINHGTGHNHALEGMSRLVELV